MARASATSTESTAVTGDAFGSVRSTCASVTIRDDSPETTGKQARAGSSVRCTAASQPRAIVDNAPVSSTFPSWMSRVRIPCPAPFDVAPTAPATPHRILSNAYFGPRRPLYTIESNPVSRSVSRPRPPSRAIPSSRSPTCTGRVQRARARLTVRLLSPIARPCAPGCWLQSYWLWSRPAAR